MKNVLMMMLVAAVTISTALAGEMPALNIGDRVPNTAQVLKDVSGADLTLKEVAEENGLLVIFTCNTCPYVLAWEDRYPAISKFCDENGIGLIMVNPNEARRHSADSYAEMKSHAADKKFDFYYAVDNNHELADAFGATKTPDVFLFNSGLELVYKGAIDDNHQDASAVQDKYLDNAMVNMLKGKEIDPNYTRAIGCSIKRVE